MIGGTTRASDKTNLTRRRSKLAAKAACFCLSTVGAFLRCPFFMLWTGRPDDRCDHGVCRCGGWYYHGFMVSSSSRRRYLLFVFGLGFRVAGLGRV